LERGTHAELLAMDGRYARLYERQQRAAGNRFINPGEELSVDT
jgi:subfamily B ATP-binding cassette protein MsbA